MLSKLLSVYKNSILFHEQPKVLSNQLFHFYDTAENKWIGIPKSVINGGELQLLKTLFLLIEEQPKPATSLEREWYEFLLLNGRLPTNYSKGLFRFIQFQFTGVEASIGEVEAALKGFFSEDVIIVWENGNHGVVVEEKKAISLAEEDFRAMLETLESDLYLKISFYIGKHSIFSDQLRILFEQENEFFRFALTSLGGPKIFTYERVFPAFLAAHLPRELKLKVIPEIFDLFSGDPELFSTIKVFLENNSNASLTAKNLYIHRNTLQYRLDKFVEKTEIDLKDFNGAFTVFLACLLFEYHNGH